MIAIGGLLVTGSGGQLGRAMARLRPDAVLFDRSSLDVTDAGAVEKAVAGHRPAVVVHAAAFTKVDAAEAAPEEAAAVNEAGTGNVARACAAAGALLVYPSSDYVFSGDEPGLRREDDMPSPLSAYGRTKLAGEAAAAAAGDHLIVRTSWVFGDGHNFVRSILRTAAQGGEVSVVDDQWGLPTDAGDLAEGILALVDAGARGTFHLAGGGEPATWAGVAEAAIIAADITARVRRVSTIEYDAARRPPVAPRPRRAVLDCSKAASLGVSLRPWRQAVAEYASELVGGQR